TSSFKRVRQDALAVGWQALQAEAQDIGEADDAVIGQVLAKDDVAWAHDAAKGEKDAMGRAVGDEDAFGAGGDTELPQPMACGFAMTMEARNRAAGAHEACNVAFRQFPEDF